MSHCPALYRSAWYRQCQRKTRPSGVMRTRASRKEAGRCSSHRPRSIARTLRPLACILPVKLPGPPVRFCKQRRTKADWASGVRPCVGIRTKCPQSVRLVSSAQACMCNLGVGPWLSGGLVLWGAAGNHAMQSRATIKSGRTCGQTAHFGGGLSQVALGFPDRPVSKSTLKGAQHACGKDEMFFKSCGHASSSLLGERRNPH